MRNFPQIDSRPFKGKGTLEAEQRVRAGMGFTAAPSPSRPSPWKEMPLDFVDTYPGGEQTLALLDKGTLEAQQRVARSAG